MSFSPTLTIKSESLPGVSFTVHRIGLGRRAEIDAKTLAARQRLRELELDYPQSSPKEEELGEQLAIAQKKVAAVDPDATAAATAELKAIAREVLAAASLETRKQRETINEEYATVQGEIRLVWIRAGLLAIAGGDVDGMTPDQLLEYGPIELAQEIYSVLTGQGRLAGPDAKNSQSPGDSGQGQTPATSTTTAVDAKNAVGTPSATVSDISQSASTRD